LLRLYPQPNKAQSAVKRSEDNDDLVLRLVEARGQKGRAKIKFAQVLKISAAVETDLIELNPRPFAASGSEIKIEM
jgi:alpha-mannosidase